MPLKILEIIRVILVRLRSHMLVDGVAVHPQLNQSASSDNRRPVPSNWHPSMRMVLTLPCLIYSSYFLQVNSTDCMLYDNARLILISSTNV
jgi:hypothetical protein